MPSSPERHHGGAPLQLFVHCATSVDYLADLNASIPGVERYAERALLLAEHDDVVCVTDEVEAAYLEYLAELGLGPAPGNLVVASRFGPVERNPLPLWQRLLQSDDALGTLSCLIRRHGSSRIHPFIASQGQFQLAAALEDRAGVPVRVAGGAPAATAYADFKHHVRAKAIELGIPVAQGEVVDLGIAGGCSQRECGILCSAMERQIGATGRVIVRGTSGAAGSATFTVERVQEIAPLAKWLAAQGDNRIFLVESMVEMTVSPNIQLRIDKASPAMVCEGVTDQRLDRSLVHGGNLFPSSARRVTDMIGWARTMGEWLRNDGFAGLAGFDFVEYLGPSGEPQAFLAEVNPRINGATYPLRLAARLNASQREAGLPEAGGFISGTVETEVETFAELRGLWDELLFSRHRGAGLIPYVPGFLPYGTVGVVALAATLAEANELYQDATEGAEALK
ncbi:MAG TPA: hypothetical protein VFY42_05910 [Gemmatimonadales bacterium]|nr:hypothetical protein [Gemmatimonadales bacterium]